MTIDLFLGEFRKILKKKSEKILGRFSKILEEKILFLFFLKVQVGVAYVVMKWLNFQHRLKIIKIFYSYFRCYGSARSN